MVSWYEFIFFLRITDKILTASSSPSGTMLRTVVGEVCFLFTIIPSGLFWTLIFCSFVQPTGTSVKFANMMEQALQQFEDEYGVKLEKITKIPLEGDGTIDKRVERYACFRLGHRNININIFWKTIQQPYIQ